MAGEAAPSPQIAAGEAQQVSPAEPVGAGSGGHATIDGYVADSLYPSTFHSAFAPPWTDAMLAWNRLPAPRAPRGPFTLVDLGCGDGVGLILLAAAHPEGRFIGIDAMAGHVARGRELAGQIGLANIHFHQCSFSDPIDMPDGIADYVTAQGVLAWVSPDNRAALLDLAGRLLCPGGIFTVGYNTQPGWGAVAGFQRLVRALAEAREGSSQERFEASLAQIREGAMVPQAVLDWLRQDNLPPAYFPQEYLNRYWEPLWSGDVIAAAAERGLVYATQAHPSRLRPDFTIKKAWREALAGIADPAAREIAADLFVNSFFRTDIYSKGPLPALDDDLARTLRLDQHWGALRTEAEAEYSTRSPIGTIGFDNAAAHAILAFLEDGPAALGSVPGIGAADLINTIDALHLARLVVPLDPPAAVPHAGAANTLLGDAMAGLAAAALVGVNGVINVPCDLDPSAAAVKRRLGIVARDGLGRASGAD